MNADLFDGDLLGGPVPTLFAGNESKAIDEMDQNPEKTHWDIQKLSKMFYRPEYVTPEEAEEIVKKPREGAVIRLFTRPRLTKASKRDDTPPPKKARNDDDNDEGM